MIYDLTVGGTVTNPYSGLDRFGRVIDSRWVQESASSSEEATDVEHVQYGYDRASNRLWRHNVVAAEQFTGGNDELYAYDGLQRLIDMGRGNLNELRTAVDDASFSQNWQLDATGNWPGFRQMNVADPTQNLDQQRSANQANEITALDRRYGVNWTPCGYDRAGNTTTFPQPVDPEAGFDATYDAWNRLVQLSDGESTVATYAYDGFNRRVKKVTGGVTRHYYYSASWQVLEERLGTSPESADAERQFLWGTRYVDDLVLRDRSPTNNGTLSERLYALQDANWNVTTITDTSGAVQERYRYSPYGSVTFLQPDFDPREPNVSSCDWESLYTGQRFDNDTDLYLYRNRYYHAGLGRFVTRDPIGYEGNNINLYHYVRSSPATATDPLGFDAYYCEILDGVAEFLDAVSKLPLNRDCILCGECLAANKQFKQWVLIVCSAACTACVTAMATNAGKCPLPHMDRVCFEPEAKEVKCSLTAITRTARQVTLVSAPTDAPDLGGNFCETGGPLTAFMATWKCEDGTSYSVCNTDLGDLAALAVDKFNITKKISGKSCTIIPCNGGETKWGNGTCPTGVLEKI